MEISEEIGRIPEYVCKKYARNNEWLFDKLMDWAVLSLVRASKKFEAHRHPLGMAAFPRFCLWVVHRRVKQKLVEMHRSWGPHFRKEIHLNQTGWRFAEQVNMPTLDLENSELVTKLLRPLLPRDRQIIMGWSQGYTFAQIGAQVGLNKENARERFHKAMKRLKESPAYHYHANNY